MVRAAGHPPAHPKVELPFRREGPAHGRKDLLLLVPPRVEACDRTERAVVLESGGNLGIEVVAELEVGRELESFLDAGSVERAVHGGVERPVPAPLLLVDDGPDFPGPGVNREDRTLVADLVRDAHPHRPVPGLGDAEARTDVVHDPVPPVPETWHWPVGVSVSNEIGYQRPIFSVDT